MERNYSEDLGIGGYIILEWILGNRVGGCRFDKCASGWPF
jgi:hypothetical protein